MAEEGRLLRRFGMVSHTSVSMTCYPSREHNWGVYRPATRWASLSVHSTTSASHVARAPTCAECQVDIRQGILKSRTHADSFPSLPHPCLEFPIPASSRHRKLMDAARTASDDGGDSADKLVLLAAALMSWTHYPLALAAALLCGLRGGHVVLTFNPDSWVYHRVVAKCRSLHGRWDGTMMLPLYWLVVQLEKLLLSDFSLNL
jgi:hypothetical protein